MSKMKKLVIVLLLLALASPGQGAFAQEGVGQVAELALTELGLPAFEVLQGPFDQVDLRFQLPADWQVLEGSRVELRLRNFFSSFVPAQGEARELGLVAGHLSVLVDGELIYRSVLSANGEQDIGVRIAPEHWQEHRGPNHELSIRWDASASCNFNLSTTLLLLPDSKLVFNYAPAAITPDLSALPYPFLSFNAPEASESLIVLPNELSEAQVAAGLSLAAALGRLSESENTLEMVAEKQLSEEERANKHLIFVGVPESFASLSGVELPHQDNAVVGSAKPDLGFIEMLNSPWNPGRAVLVVGGGSQEAVLAAAIQLGRGELLLNPERNLALVERGSLSASGLQDFETATFSQLGEGDRTFRQYGSSSLSIPFFIAPDRPISAEAYVDLRVAHSLLIDYLRSGISLSVNGQPLGSLRTSDQTAAKHSEFILLPPALLKAGLNSLELHVEIFPRDICASEEDGNRWLSVFADSSINLPTDQSAQAAQPSLDGFGLFPMPFLHEGMQNAILLLPAENAEILGPAARLLLGLSARFLGWPLVPEIRYAEGMDLGELNGKNLILLGHFDDFLSVPGFAESFSVGQNEEGQGEIEFSNGSRFAFDPDYDLGFLEFARREGSGEQVLAILGSSPQSLDQAVESLLSPVFALQNRNEHLVLLQDGEAIQDDLAFREQETGPGSSEQEVEQNVAEVSTGKGLWLVVVFVLLGGGLITLVAIQGLALLRKRR